MFDIQQQIMFPRGPSGRYSPSNGHSPPRKSHDPLTRLRNDPCPSPTVSVDSISDQFQARVSLVSPVSHLDPSSPVSPESMYQQPFETQTPFTRNGPNFAPRARPDPLANSLPSNDSNSLGDMPAPLRTSSRNPPQFTHQRSDTAWERPSPVEYTLYRRHASGDHPPALFHGTASSAATYRGGPFQSLQNSPPPGFNSPGDPDDPARYLDAQASLQGYLDRDLPPLPSPSPSTEYDASPGFTPDQTLLHVNSAPTSLQPPRHEPRPISDSIMPPPASVHRSPADGGARRASSVGRVETPDLEDVTDVALFAEALQGLGPDMTHPLLRDVPGTATLVEQPQMPPETPSPLAHHHLPQPVSDPHAWSRSAPATPPRQHTPSPPRAAPPPTRPPFFRNASATAAAPPAPFRATMNRGWDELELNEAVLGIGNQALATHGPDDELPDYQTSQREAAERSRRAALSRAAELENRWRGSTPFRSR